MRKFNVKLSNSILILVALVAMVGGATVLFYMQHGVKKGEKQLTAQARPSKIQLVLIKASDCKECADAKPFIEQVNNNTMVKITKDKIVEYNAKEGAELIEKYKITKVPTVLLTGDVQEKQDVSTWLKEWGTIENDGTFVLRETLLPYLDLATKTVKGKFDAIMITDKTCKECYDVALHTAALQHLGMKPQTQKNLDVLDAEGKRLIAAYSIKSVPALLLAGDLADYKGFQQVWPQVGTVEKDGMHIFRAGNDLMGAYRDLATGKVKNLSQATTAVTAPSVK